MPRRSMVTRSISDILINKMVTSWLKKIEKLSSFGQLTGGEWLSQVKSALKVV